MNSFLNMEEMMKNKSPKEIALNIVNKIIYHYFPVWKIQDYLQ